MLNNKIIEKLLKLICSVFTMVIISGFIVSNISNADVGNINRYDDGTTSSSSSSSSYGEYSSSSSRSSSSSELSPGMVVIVLVALGIYIVLDKTGKLKEWGLTKDLNTVSSSAKTEVPTYIVNADENAIVEEIRKEDTNFSKEDFSAFTREVFMKLQQAWTARDWKVIRPFESEELFNQHKVQLDEYIRLGKINVVERINVEQIKIFNHVIDGDKEKVDVYLSAVLRDYIINDRTKQVIEGNPNKDWYMKYKLTF